MIVSKCSIRKEQHFRGGKEEAVVEESHTSLIVSFLIGIVGLLEKSAEGIVAH